MTWSQYSLYGSIFPHYKILVIININCHKTALKYGYNNKNITDLENKINRSSEIISFLQNLGVLNQNHRCSLCRKNIKMIRSKSSNGFILRCHGKSVIKRQF
ncbi:hypothetical protein SLOPH_632 [Spraguea lophii 42_110]|uniref:Uncharacterized protein n=1 Tax=Spraguea lophii (strain 42_110) TaxID=1358809 RepID=S7XPI8_SPRLO|nr:hypothetical protein SLOPH_632 [Spraguea lophii 42_110]